MNLLPHRQARRERQSVAFAVLLGLSALLAALVVLAVGGWNGFVLAQQERRSEVLQTALTELDQRVAVITTLRQDIAALTARQQVLDALQAGRNGPVRLLAELVSQTPPGMALTALRQDGLHVSVSGQAKSQPVLAQFLRNLGSGSPWLERPELVELHSAALAGVEFTVLVTVRASR